jgi:methyl-accepting chemotaxis protein
MADLVRVTCPLLAKEFDGAVAELSEWQKVRAVKRVEEAIAHSKVTTEMSVALAFAGILCSLLVGGMFASSITKNITKNIEALSQSAHEIHQKSQDMSKISSNLSEAAAQQAASLQETVASIDEISAMVARNSDSAVVSVENSEKSTLAVKNGKENVQLMMNSIHSIEVGNKEVMEKIQSSNKEISEIVLVIRDIATKTKVINDIVFQTKLLSFNASVEAARAGEHGRGFSVVAEEIGNLATMSGSAANEISMMLDSSVKSVSDIVERTTTMMDAMMRKNTEKVEQGIFTAKQCTESLEDILSNVARVNQLVNEISLSSQEQATGIKEINKTMSELDDVTQQNSDSAQNSNQAALVLNGQVDRLNTIVSDLSLFIQGKAA